MGKTRKRVTFLILSLEGIGLLMLVVSVYLAGSMRLECEKLSDSGGIKISCEATEQRFLGLVTLQHRRYENVEGVVAETPGLGRSDFWLTLNTSTGSDRILAGSRTRTDVDVKHVNSWMQGGETPKLALQRSAAPWAVTAAIFGCVWIFVISLIMREFLGYHTPWWWRALGKK